MNFSDWQFKFNQCGILPLALSYYLISGMRCLLQCTFDVTDWFNQKREARVIRQKIRFPNCGTCNFRDSKKSLALHFQEMHFDYCFQSNQTDPYWFSINTLSVVATVTFHLWRLKWTYSVWTDNSFVNCVKYIIYFILSSYFAKY